MEPVQLPDERAFRAFRAECEAEQGWLSRYDREGVAVWAQLPAPGAFAVHRVKVRVRPACLPGGRAPGGGGETGCPSAASPHARLSLHVRTSRGGGGDAPESSGEGRRQWPFREQRL